MSYLLFRNKFIVVSCLWLLAFSLYALTVGTYNSPPFSMYEDGEDIGMATESVKTLLNKSGITDYKIIIYPLARGLAEFQAGRIDIYYPYLTEFNDNNKQFFILLGPIAKYNVAFFVRKNYAHPVSMPALQELLVGAERGSIGDLLLQKHAMHIEQATQELSCLRMVLAERITACALGTLPGMYVAALNNYSDQLRHVETGEYANLYVAISPNLPAETIAELKATFENLQRENYFVMQQLDYEKKFALFVKSLS